jgi:uncharacterized membrane protein
MGDVLDVAVAAVAFVGTHFLLSHPLRAPLVRLVGERGFLGLYSAVAALTLGWLILAYRYSPLTPALWPVGDTLWAIASAVMLVAAILFTGSLVRNPALPSPDGAPAIPDEARGVYAVTRHPMMWSFALWSLAHAAVLPVASNLLLVAAIALLALVGAAMQDRRKEQLLPGWAAWEARTSYWPFAAILSNRARLAGLGGHALGGGLVLWLAATWAHLPLAGFAAGVWRWLL